MYNKKKTNIWILRLFISLEISIFNKYKRKWRLGIFLKYQIDNLKIVNVIKYYRKKAEFQEIFKVLCFIEKFT